MKDNRPKSPQFYEACVELSDDQLNQDMLQTAVLEGALAEEVAAKLTEINDWFTSRNLHHIITVAGNNHDCSEPRMQMGAHYAGPAGMRLASAALMIVAKPRGENADNAEVCVPGIQRDLQSMGSEAYRGLLYQMMQDSPAFKANYEKWRAECASAIGGLLGAIFGMGRPQQPPQPPTEETDAEGSDD